MLKTNPVKKVVLSVTVNPEIIDELRKYKARSGVSASWIVSNLLANYLEAMRNYNV